LAGVRASFIDGGSDNQADFACPPPAAMEIGDANLALDAAFGSGFFAALIFLGHPTSYLSERMSDTIEVPRAAFEPKAMLERDGLFKDEQDALRSLVIDQAEAKIRHYDSLIKEMRGKYGMSFEEFKNQIESRICSESFDEWDDFIIWETYESSRKYWADVLACLKAVKEGRFRISSLSSSEIVEEIAVM